MVEGHATEKGNTIFMPVKLQTQERSDMKGINKVVLAQAEM